MGFMGTTQIQPTKRGANIDRLTTQQQKFVVALLATEAFSPLEAAKAAGYKTPSQAAYKLLGNPIVAAAVGKAIHQRNQRLELKADDLLDHLRNAIYLDPIEIFEQSEDGAGFYVKRLGDIPEALRRCVTKIESYTTYDRDGNPRDTKLKVEFMSKDGAMALAMRHMGMLGKDGGTNLNINVDARMVAGMLKDMAEGKNVVDAKFIEERI